MKRALITGVTGQDGSYLAEWLLAKGYRTIRFQNEDVYESMNWVIAEILKALNAR